MTLIKPGQGRSQIEEQGLGLKVTIPSKKNILIILFLCAWMGGWFMGEIFAIRELISGKASNGSGLFLAFWLCAWTIGGIFVLFAILWNIAGKEIITLSNDTLKIERKIFDIGITHEYLISEITNLRSLEIVNSSIFSSRNPWEFWGFGGGTIAFDYGLKTIRLAQSIDKAEADYIIKKTGDFIETRENY